jgi:hypothetical protein
MIHRRAIPHKLHSHHNGRGSTTGMANVFNLPIAGGDQCLAFGVDVSDEMRPVLKRAKSR